MDARFRWIARGWLPAGTGIDASSPTRTGSPFSGVGPAGSVAALGGIEKDGSGGSEGSDGSGIGDDEEPGIAVPYGIPATSGAVPSLPVTAVIVVAPLVTKE
jgi:hypothetical protein